MLYAREVMDLLEPYPGREFRMVQIVRYVANGRPLDLKARRAMRKGVLRVLAALAESKLILVRPAKASRGGPAMYAWRKHGD